MGSFQRNGSFQDRDKFVVALKENLGSLKQGPMSSMKEEWAEEGGNTIGKLSGFGVKITLTVKETDWDCNTEVPMMIPQGMVEEKLDKFLGKLEGV